MGDEMASPPGANGTVVPDTRGEDSALVPSAFVALTAIQYVVTLLRPLISHVRMGSVAVQVENAETSESVA